MNRKITKIIVHCSATPPSQDIGGEEIDEWHLKRGFDGIGYHNVIRRDGGVEFGRSLMQEGAHVRGHNEESIGICLVGGIDEAGASEPNYTENQMTSLRGLLAHYTEQWPEAYIRGHGDIEGTARDCPCFSVSNWLMTGKIIPVRGAA